MAMHIAGIWIFSGAECRHAGGAHLENRKIAPVSFVGAAAFKFEFEWSNTNYNNSQYILVKFDDCNLLGSLAMIFRIEKQAYRLSCDLYYLGIRPKKT